MKVTDFVTEIRNCFGSKDMLVKKGSETYGFFVNKESDKKIVLNLCLKKGRRTPEMLINDFNRLDIWDDSGFVYIENKRVKSIDLVGDVVIIK